MPAKGKCLRRGKASKVMGKAEKPSGDHHVMTIGSQVVAHKDIIVPSTIQEDSQADVQSADRLVILPLSVLVQSSPRPRMSSGKSPPGLTKKKIGMTINGSQRSMKRPRERKEKGKDRSLKGSQECAEIDYSKAITVFTVERRPIPTQIQTRSVTSYSLCCQQSLSRHGDTQHGMGLTT